MPARPDAGRRSVREVFDRVAHLYDTELVQTVVYRPIHDRVVAELRRTHPRRVLDVGCGTGLLAARILTELHPEAVYGCDLSPGMLAQAAARSPKVGWINAAAEHLPLRDGNVDALISTTAFHFFDQPEALAEFHRVLTPGGVAIIAVPNPRTRIASRVLTRGIQALGGGSFPTERDMIRQVRNAGFRVRSRNRAAGIRGIVDPTVVTVATRPGSDERAAP
ncbi:MAG: class I SAM-dependent methyltransferase [Acidimicrobiales bacterium]